jgi:acetyl-CoA carboxylase biotin carboxyl carrier protein
VTQSGGGRNGGPKNTVDQALIRELAALLKETELTEIEIEQNGLRLRIARQIQSLSYQVPAALPAAPAAMPAAAAPVENDLAKHPGVVLSPMVGTVYVAAEPTAPAFVKVGDMVKEGQTLLIVEAMKTMNQIASPRAGRVTRILVQNAHPVEYGEPLMIIE